MDGARGNSGRDERHAIRLLEIHPRFRLLPAHDRPRSQRILDRLGHFLGDLVAAAEDRGPERCHEPPRGNPLSDEPPHGLSGHTSHGAPPACVDCRGGPSLPVGEEQRDAVGGSNRGNPPDPIVRTPEHTVRLGKVCGARSPHEPAPVDLPHEGGPPRKASGPEKPPAPLFRRGVGPLRPPEIEVAPSVGDTRREGVGHPPHLFQGDRAKQDDPPDFFGPKQPAHGRREEPGVDRSGPRRGYSREMSLSELFSRARREHVRALDAFLERHSEDLDRLARWCADSLARGGKLLLFGNGGSAAEAQHLAAEFVNRFDRERSALPALALTTDGAILTSVGNDADFREIFARQIEAHGRPGDIAFGLSTSGRSPNVLAGLEAARRIGLRTAAFLGRDGGPASRLADLPLVVPAEETPTIQEVHLFAGHLLCRRVEDLLDEARKGRRALTS